MDFYNMQISKILEVIAEAMHRLSFSEEYSISRRKEEKRERRKERERGEKKKGEGREEEGQEGSGLLFGLLLFSYGYGSL